MGKTAKTMKPNVLSALQLIHLYCLDNSEWNIEKYETAPDYYGKNMNEAAGSIPPHIAIYESISPTDIEQAIYLKCDFAIYTEDKQMIYIYTF